MADGNVDATTSSDRELVLTRVFDAPRTRVFEAWTTPKYVARWWGPGEFTLPVCEIDLRPGGAYLFVMRDADGNDYPLKGVYHEVVPPERLVYSDRVEMPDGASPESIVTVTFVEHRGQTTVTISALHKTVADRHTVEKMMWAEGWTESLNRLAEHLAGTGDEPHQ